MRVRRCLRGLLLIAPGLVFVGHFAFAAYQYDVYLYGPSRILRYYVAPLALAALYLGALLKASRRTAILIATNTYAVIAALLLFELYPYFLDHGRPSVADPADPAAEDKVLALLRLRASGREAYPAFSVLGINDLIGAEGREDGLVSNLPLVTTVLCRQEGEWISYEADRHGFNNPVVEWDEGRPGDLQVAVIGDSFIQGWCLPRRETIVGRLQRHGLRAASFGIMGHSPLLELEVLKRYVAPLEPRHVVWCYYAGNDLAELDQSSRVPWLVRALDEPPAGVPPAHKRRVVQAVKATLDGMIDRRPSREEATAWHRINWTHVLGFRRSFAALGLHYGRAGGRLDLFARVMEQAGAIVRGWGGTLHLCYLPDDIPYAGLLPGRAAHEDERRVILDIAREFDIDVIDVAPGFDEHPAPPELFGEDGIHYSSEGAAIAAAAIHRALRDGPGLSPRPEARAGVVLDIRYRQQ
jgi:lysophospholipase L1-like esterase